MIQMLAWALFRSSPWAYFLGSPESIAPCCLQVKVLFLILVDLCRRTAALHHPLPVSQVGSNNIIIRLHYIDGNYTVLPEVVEASLGPHIQVSNPPTRGQNSVVITIITVAGGRKSRGIKNFLSFLRKYPF